MSAMDSIDGVSRFISKLFQAAPVDRFGFVSIPSGMKLSELLRVDSRETSTRRTASLLAQNAHNDSSILKPFYFLS